MADSERKRSNRADVMISSTTLDLPAHRKAAIDAVWRRGMYPLAMEAGTATPNDAIKFSLDKVNEAEVYVGIFGYRYGYVPVSPKNPTGLSITEMEYRRALERNLPILIFVMSDDHPGPKVSEHDTFYETDPASKTKLQALKAELKTRFVVGFFDSPQDLSGKIYQALTELKEKGLIEFEPDAPSLHNPAVKLIPAAPEPYLAHPYILTRDFFGRKDELRLLDEWGASEDTTMIVEAIGGIGKSAVTWEWFKTKTSPLSGAGVLSADAKNRVPTHQSGLALPQFAGAMWWSFYESDATVSNFIRHALAYVANQPVEAYQNMPYDEREAMLLAALKQRPYLLALDGLERILVAYHTMNASYLTDDQVETEAKDEETRKRGCTDPRDGAFLQKLAGCMPTKILISTRLIPADLEDRGSKKLMPGIRHKHLNGLHPDDALDLMRHLGISGDGKAIQQFTGQFDNHSLLLTLIAGRINEYRPAPGSFDAWHRAEGGHLRLHDPEMKQRRTHILQYAMTGLKPELRRLLSQIAAFRYPVDYAALAALNPFAPPRPARVENPNTVAWLTAHLRSDSKEREIQKAAWVAYQTALENYPKPDSPEMKAALIPFHAGLTDLADRGLLQWDRPANRYDLHPVVRGYAFETLEGEERTRAFNQINDYFQATPAEDTSKASELADLRRSLEIYHALVGAGRLGDASRFYGQRLQNVLVYNIAAYPAIVELLTPLFPDGLEQLPRLSDPAQQSARLTNMANVFSYVGQTERARALQGLTLKLTLERKNTADLGVGLRNYANSLRDTNRLAGTLRPRELARDLAEAASDADGLAMSYLFLLNSYADTGQWAQAEAAYRRFNDKPPSNQTAFWETDAERYYAESLIYRGLEAGVTLDKTWELAVRSRNALSQRDILYWRGELALQHGQAERAAEVFQDAIALARKHGASNVAAYLGGLARARAGQGRYDEARQLVGQGVNPIDAAEVYLALGEVERAKERALAAYESAWADGPPFVFWWYLERAKQALAALGVPEPVLPPFDPAKVEKLPYEDEIRAFIEELRAKGGKADEDAGG